MKKLISLTVMVIIFAVFTVSAGAVPIEINGDLPEGFLDKIDDVFAEALALADFVLAEENFTVSDNAVLGGGYRQIIVSPELLGKYLETGFNSLIEVMDSSKESYIFILYSDGDPVLIFDVDFRSEAPAIGTCTGVYYASKTHEKVEILQTFNKESEIYILGGAYEVFAMSGAQDMIVSEEGAVISASEYYKKYMETYLADRAAFEKYYEETGYERDDMTKFPVGGNMVISTQNDSAAEQTNPIVYGAIIFAVIAVAAWLLLRKKRTTAK